MPGRKPKKKIKFKIAAKRGTAYGSILAAVAGVSLGLYSAYLILSSPAKIERDLQRTKELYKSLFKSLTQREKEKIRKVTEIQKEELKRKKDAMQKLSEIDKKFRKLSAPGKLSILMETMEIIARELGPEKVMKVLSLSSFKNLNQDLQRMLIGRLKKGLLRRSNILLRKISSRAMEELLKSSKLYEDLEGEINELKKTRHSEELIKVSKRLLEFEKVFTRELGELGKYYRKLK